MWPLARAVLAGAYPVPIDDAAAAVRLLVNRARIVAEGAGALALAAALAGRGGSGKVVCIVSGGNIDEVKLRTILSGATP
jgi:threonine dehydratase